MNLTTSSRDTTNGCHWHGPLKNALHIFPHFMIAFSIIVCINKRIAQTLFCLLQSQLIRVLRASLTPWSCSAAKAQCMSFFELKRAIYSCYSYALTACKIQTKISEGKTFIVGSVLRLKLNLNDKPLI